VEPTDVTWMDMPSEQSGDVLGSDQRHVHTTAGNDVLLKDANRDEHLPVHGKSCGGHVQGIEPGAVPYGKESPYGRTTNAAEGINEVENRHTTHAVKALGSSVVHSMVHKVVHEPWRQ